ncbi:MAG: sugar phosphate isomerase/epimerase family protein [Vicinamibacterales bacterium]
MANGTKGISRRELGRLVIGGVGGVYAASLAAQQKPNSTIAGVRIGAQSYSFRGMSLADTVSAMAGMGLSFCELWQGQVETRDVIGPPAALPADAPRDRQRAAQREALRRWRLEVPLDHFRDIRRMFDTAGVTLTAYNLSFQNDFTDEEIERGFEMARALGVDVITASSSVSTAARVDPFAQKAGITVGFHNHSRVAPDEFASPESFAAALEGRSNRLAINLDIGHFTGAGFDALAYLTAHHDRIVSLHLKDKTKDDRNVTWGEGDTPIVEVLRTLRDRHWDIPTNIEYEYRGTDAVTEVRRCLDYCRRALA